MVVKIRDFVDNDLPILAKLLNEQSKGSYQFVPITEERLRSWIQDGKLEVLVVEENGKIVGSAAYADGYWGEEIKWFIIDETMTEKEVEDRLVGEMESFVKRGSVFATVDAGSIQVDEWVRRGYKLEEGLYHMVARLDWLRAVSKVPEGVVLRSLGSDEENRLVEAVNAGFGWERLKMGSIQHWRTENPPFSEEWVQVAEFDGKIISVVVAKPDTFYNQFFSGNRGYLGPAATLPEHRGKYLASALTCQAMNFLFVKGMNSVALYTAERNTPSVVLLKKLGFEIGHNWKFMRKTLNEQKMETKC